MAYPLGWSVVSQMLVRRERWPGGYGMRGMPLVRLGQEVEPNQPVIRLESMSRSNPIPDIPRLSLPSVPTVRMPVASDFSNASIQANLSGTPTNSSAYGRMYEIIPAGLRGRVVDITPHGGVVIESRAAVIQGALGAGKQVAGILTIWGIGTQFIAPNAEGRLLGTGHPYNSRGQQQIPPGAILVIPGPLNFAMLRQAMRSGVAGVVASSISSRDLEAFLRTDLIQLIDSEDADLAQAHLPPLTLLLTEGLGTMAMPARTINLLSQHQDEIVLLSGATSVRQGIFPELIISLPTESQENWHLVQPDPVLAIGAQVRICSGSYEGALGEVNYLFTHQQTFPSGVRSRAVRLRLEDGSMLVVPISLIERIG